jgi:ketosteroid isomerase-like protein
MACDTVTEEELDQLVRRTADAATAYLNGDMQTYVALIGHTDDYTLLAPYGGEPRRGFDSSDRALAATAGFFRGGEASLEVFQTYASGDLVVLVAVERQHGEVGGLPDQDWSLRVTLVYRRDGSGWLLAHRHADPLVHGFGHAQIAAIARGDSGGT